VIEVARPPDWALVLTGVLGAVYFAINFAALFTRLRPAVVRR